MPAKRSTSRTTTASLGRSGADDDSVDELLATLVHPHKGEIVALRAIILGAHPSITDGIKWNAPSFRTTEWFATIHLRAKVGVQLILHLGAKVKSLSPEGMAINDPGQLLTWLGKDRATIVFRDLDDLTARRAALERLLRSWIAYV